MVDQVQLDAAYAEMFPKAFTEINDANLMLPIDVGIWQIGADLRRKRLILVRRALLAVHFEICSGGLLKGTIPAPLMADWLWGPGRKPRHWRSQMAKTLSRVEEHMLTAERTKTLSLALDGEQVAYDATSGFLCCLAPMVRDGRLRLLRNVRVNRRVTADQIARLNTIYNAGGYVYDEKDLRGIIAHFRQNFASLPTLSSLGRERKIFMIFIPSLLGVPSVCKALGLTVRALAANLTRSYRVEQAKVLAFTGNRQIVCPLLDPNTTYSAFAANGKPGRGGPGSRTGRAGRGYLMARWLMFHGLKEGREKRLLQWWAKAAGPLQLTVVGIDRANKLYSLDDLLTAGAATLERLHIRLYTPLGWQQAWTKVFGMSLPAAGAAEGGKAARKTPMVGDLPELASLVREKGVRATARVLKLNPGNLSNYLHGRGGLTAARVAELRQHLFATLPLGGPEIEGEFAALLEKYPGNLGWALAYRRLLCWSVVPLKPQTREGHIKWKPYQTALPSEQEIIQWWAWWPKANIGLILGPLSRVFAIDVDNEPADEALKQLLGGLPDCPRQLSGSWSAERPWKRHYLFNYPIDVPSGAKSEPLVPGLEFRGNRGLLILAPSTHKSGTGAYGWDADHAIWKQPLPPVPDQVRQLLIAYADGKAPSQLKSQQAPQPQATTDVVLPALAFKGRRFSRLTQEFLAKLVQPGERNNRLFAAAREMRDYGATREQAANQLVCAARALGLDDNEIMNTINSAYSRAPNRRAG